ncbi:MAG: MBL fold metallo-hydrolase [Lentimicrobium sp.]|jgi:glyoxylase-like metal-dependent hydrolase (beta-lactamase superfamily II)|nr:MBL fold metallo-hydrolase [Lentimicrobium sp.]
MQLFAIPTGNFKLDGGAMFGVVPKSLWSKNYPSDENNLINMAMRCLLIVDEDRKILINNGIGDKQSEKFFSHYHLNGDDSLLKSLAAAGYKPEDITDMFLTHLHFDHCGGSVKYTSDGNAFETVFPNATYWISGQQWDWAMNANRRESASFLRENIKPIEESGRLKLFDHPGELFPGIEIRFYNGHTEGQAIPFISYKGKTLVFTSDLLPTHAHLPLPWVMSYDTRPLITLDEKETFLEEAVKNGYILYFEHDLYTECCTLKQTEKGIKVDKVFKLNEIDQIIV